MEIDKNVWETSTRTADLFLCLQGGSVFADFAIDTAGLVSLIRISFDGYGCCGLPELGSKMTSEESRLLREAFEADDLARDDIRELLRRYFRLNQDQIWKDALEEHELL